MCTVVLGVHGSGGVLSILGALRWHLGGIRWARCFSVMRQAGVQRRLFDRADNLRACAACCSVS